jgi:hypothetical protein
MRASNSKFLVVISLALATAFIAAAHIELFPIMRRGLTGGGFYVNVDELKFVELALLTAMTASLAALILKLPARAWLATLTGSVTINVGLLVADVRAHDYGSVAERFIANLFGPPAMIWLYALLSLAGGIALLRRAWRSACRPS